MTQAFRVAIGFPQSLVSIGDFPQRLRLWIYGDASFPASPAIGVIAVFYAAVALATASAYRMRRALTQHERILVICAVAAIGLNFAFAMLWQGTDLERYFPSLPFQMLAVGLVVSRTTWSRSMYSRASAIVAIGLLALANWYGNFDGVFARDSFRQCWLRDLARVARAGDVVVVLGNRKSQLTNPHDPTFPAIVNISGVLAESRSGWRDAIVNRITKARARGHKVFLGDSVLSLDDAPRDGWSFRQFPTPSPAEIAAVFEPMRSSRLAFVACGEQVWEADVGLGSGR